MKISIVGAGPAGLISGLELLELGSTTIYEQNATIKTTPCAECISLRSLEELRKNTRFDSSPYISKKVKGIKIVFPKGNEVFLFGEGALINREEWLKGLYEEFRKRGGVLHFGRKVKSLADLRESDVIIGADGPWSVMRESIGGKVGELRPVFYSKIRYDTQEMEYATFYVDKDCSPYYLWAFPKKDILNVGGNDKKGLEMFMEKQGFVGEIVESGSWVDSLGGSVYQYENVYLIGDAASTTNIFSAGGLGPIIRSAHILAECLKSGKGFETKIRELIVIKEDKDAKEVLKRLTSRDLEKIGRIINGDSILNPSFLTKTKALFHPLLVRKMLVLRRGFAHAAEMW